MKFNQIKKSLSCLIGLLFFSSFFFMMSCEEKKASNLERIKSLDADWTFRKVGDSEWMKATVPGNVHMDLLKSELIEDPFYRTNENDLQWIEGEDWEYKSSFILKPNDLTFEKQNIVFEGLDTYASVKLNGVEILSADNMFRTWQVDVMDYLRAGENELSVTFFSPTETVEPQYDSLPFHYPSNIDPAPKQLSVFVRKAPYHFGWDWGPRFATCGIWRPIKLVLWNDLSIKDINIKQHSLTTERAKSSAVIQVESTKEGKAELNLTCSKEGLEVARATQEVELVVGQNEYSIPFEVEDPKWWWPNGLGEAHLYDIQVDVMSNKKTASVTERIGFRTVRVDTTTQKEGQNFSVVINGHPVFMKGANYIPQDNFLNRVSADQYGQLIQDVKDANMNMLRVWGGGIYEEDLFYDLCDENGIMIWQDFMFSCAMYPGNPEFLESVKAEVIDNVKRLRDHPSIALWCGDNENEMFWNSSWSRWRKTGPASIWDDYLALKEVLSGVVAEYDPGRLYHWSSPSSLDYGVEPNDHRYGDVHYWGVWHNEEPFDNYYLEENTGRFMSEYGFQSFPIAESVARFALDEDMKLESEVMLLHQKNAGGNIRIKNYMDKYFGTPKDFSSFLYVSQVQQAEAMKIAVEHHRRSMPYTMGSLYWQLNDCWPAASWAGIDYYGNWKALHHYAKDFFAPIHASIVGKTDFIEVHVTNDFLEHQEVHIQLDLMSFDGKVLNTVRDSIILPENSNLEVWSISNRELLDDHSPQTSYLKVTLVKDGELVDENRYFFEKWKDLPLSNYDLSYELLKEADKVVIRLSSSSFVKSLYLQFEDLNGRFSENFFDLEPGVEKVVTFKPNGTFKNQDLIWISLKDAIRDN